MRRHWLTTPLACIFLFSSLFGQTTYRALFLGNSYTFFSSMPAIVANLANSGGDTLIHDSSTPGGYTLEGHSTNATSLAKIAQGNWDYVVLQGQSQRPSFSPGQVAQEVLPYAAILSDSIKSANPCTEPVFFMTWGRKNGDQNNCQFYPPVCTYEGMQTRLKSSYVLMATDNEATVAPAGMAFWESRLQDPNLELYNPDQSHPSYAGSYLTACVFYSSFFRKSPVGLSFYGSLDSTTATFLQNVAETVVMDSLDQWRIGANDVSADFSLTFNNPAEVDFMDMSTNATSWMWDFGDGNTSTAANPTHTYAGSGTYTITLIATDGCTSDTTSLSQPVTIVGIEDRLQNSLSVYPVPNQGTFQVNFEAFVSQDANLSLIDGLGKVMLEKHWEIQTGENQLQFEQSDLSPGIYFLRLELDQGVVTRRIVLE